MGTAVSLLMIAAGAIMVWAVTATVSGISIRRRRARTLDRVLVELGRLQRRRPG
jgi:hypothetical protein